MNRIAPLLEAESPTDATPPASCFSSVGNLLPPAEATSVAPPSATFIPIHYESRYAYPLIVWLHGEQGNERQLRRVMPQVSMRNCVAVGPRGTCCIDGSAGRSSRGPGAFTWEQSVSGIEAAEARVFQCITAARERFHIHPERIFLAGYGSGGTMAVRLAWNHPHTFAGVATLMGPIPENHRPLRRVNEIRGLPLLLAAGLHSASYDEPHVCRNLRLLHSAGFTVALRQYVCGDALMTDMLKDLNEWVMEIVCNHPAKRARTAGTSEPRRNG